MSLFDQSVQLMGGHLPTVPQAKITMRNFMALAVPAEENMAYRPNEATIDTQRLDILKNTIHNANGMTADALQPIASAIIAPSLAPKGIVNIDNGWGSSRMAIRMMFDIDSGLGVGGSKACIISGYTDHLGAMNGQNGKVLLDDDMRIYLGGEVDVTTRRKLGANSSGTDIITVDNNQIITPFTVSGGINSPASHMAGAIYGMRPSDALRTAQVTGESMRSDYAIKDIRNAIGNQSNCRAILARRSNASSASWLSKVMTATASSAADQNQISGQYGFIAGGDAALLGSASILTLDGNVTDKPVLDLIISKTQYGLTNYVTVGELRKLFPNMDMPNVQTIGLPKHASELSIGATGGTNTFNNASPMTNVAYRISTVIPTALWDNNIASVSLHITNRTVDRTPHISFISPVQMLFDSLDPIIAGRTLEQRIRGSIIREILDSVGDYSVTLKCEMSGSIRVELSLNGSPMEPYNYPSYCDGLLSTMVGLDQEYTKGTNSLIAHVAKISSEYATGRSQ